MSSVLLITHPHGHRKEREYIFQVLFNEFLGISYVSRETIGEKVQIQLVDAPEQGVLILPDVLFQTQVDDVMKIMRTLAKLHPDVILRRLYNHFSA